MLNAPRLTGIVEEDLQDICRRVGERLRALEGSTLLVAGGNGFLPGYLVDAVAHANTHVLRRPCRLICVDNFMAGGPARGAAAQDRSDVRVIQHDITNPLVVDEPIEYIIHAASIASPPRYRQLPLQTVDVNVLGTRRLLELARQHAARRFLYLSSSEVYGDPAAEAIPTPETYHGNVSCTGPRACYDESKRLAETLCMIYHREFRVPVVVVRPFNVYGPRLRLDDGRIIPDLLKDALAGRPLTLYSDGKATRSFCYVTDAVTALLLLLVAHADGEVFNVGNDEEVTIEEVAQRLQALFGGPSDLRYARHADEAYVSDNPRRRCPDLTKIKAAIPWTPLVALQQGLERTAQWYLDQGGAR